MKKILFLLFIICFTLVGCNQEKQPTDSVDSNTLSGGDFVKNEYVPTDTSVTFSDENSDKVITEATFDISKYTGEAGYYIKPYQLFSSGMCLQRDAVNRLWGKCSKTKFIAAELNGEVYYGTVNNKDWEIYLPKMNAGGPYKLTLISEAGRITLTDVYVGEVFLLSGQSNMEWTMGHSGSLLKDYYSTSDCVNDEIRMLHMGFYPQAEPTVELANTRKWTGANKTTISEFSAVGYLFGKQLQEELECPVGLIFAAIGGSSIEFWLSEENYNKVSETYNPYTTSEVYMTPCQGYNGMLYPLNGLNARGVLWYQGCSNAFGTQEYYDIALEIFIEQCKQIFANDQLAFTICELARYEGSPYAYSIINEKINKVAANNPNIVVARNLDLGDWKDIHPKDKREIAKRAAYETLRVFYKKDKEEQVKVNSYTFNDDGSVTIILSRDVKLVNDNNGFEVCINGKYTYDCNVTVNGNEITVTASGEITKVRYGYTCNMTEEVMSDVSKMVTIYDLNCFPLDLFLI